MEDLVIVKNDKAFCTSLRIAADFEKIHRNVTRDIDKLIAQNGAVKKMFFHGIYKAENGQNYKMYEMTRDGFSLLVMGFTGEKALEWKLKYIEAFNLAERIIKEHSTAEWVEAREQSKIGRKEATEVYKGFVDYAEASGSRNAKMYYKHFTVLAHNIVGITDRDQASAIQLCQLVQVEQMISLLTSEKTKEGKEYHQVFREVKAEMEEYAKMSRFKEIQNVWNNKRRVEIASRQA